MLTWFAHINLWLPGALTWPGLLLISRFTAPFEKDPDDSAWHFFDPRIAPTKILTDFLQKPDPLAWLYLIMLLAIIGLTARIASRFRKGILFWTIFFTTFTIRFLDIVSGLPDLYHHEFWLYLNLMPWDSAFPLKAFFLFLVINDSIWDSSYLSFYTGDVHSNVLPDDNDLEYQQHPETEHCPCSRPLTFWDAMIRLAYYHVVDSLLHSLHMRGLFMNFTNNKPYTEYVNNSELLQILLTLEMVVWSCLRESERSLLRQDDVECNDEKHEKNESEIHEEVDLTKMV